eukprot:GHVU01129497.1.p2 GENE.GHVU01129497.1~~GHVU01129497.1.p2  ORF type:complete len:101 (-),score=8.25 GHVU01129497.1:440-742(-)
MFPTPCLSTSLQGGGSPAKSSNTSAGDAEFSSRSTRDTVGPAKPIGFCESLQDVAAAITEQLAKERARSSRRLFAHLTAPEATIATRTNSRVSVTNTRRR